MWINLLIFLNVFVAIIIPLALANDEAKPEKTESKTDIIEEAQKIAKKYVKERGVTKLPNVKNSPYYSNISTLTDIIRIVFKKPTEVKDKGWKSYIWTYRHSDYNFNINPLMDKKISTIVLNLARQIAEEHPVANSEAMPFNKKFKEYIGRDAIKKGLYSLQKIQKSKSIERQTRSEKIREMRAKLKPIAKELLETHKIVEQLHTQDAFLSEMEKLKEAIGEEDEHIDEKRAEEKE
ncbi:hypothetical protein DdX_12708 [Ditylenchus destructor]|uniref:Uncharacterized protein n=1 Tax=Ditylenchus destructor TaxID=166010 RepID=A0AAD4MX86_9BILA|nr:hypothetical protein DdX_12708 [Ditylenchus destructor]